MKKLSLIIALFTVTSLMGQTMHSKNGIIEKKEGSITFVVDEGLEPIQRFNNLSNGEEIAKTFLSSEALPSKPNIVATSFANEKNLVSLGTGKDAFFRCIVEAYANHQSLVLSPDMIWLLISQGFARYVNAHPEELRYQLVGHDGKVDLVVVTPEELLTGNPDWGQIMGDFSKEIQKHTKGDIAQTITADFTTTTPVTRIASEITLMESVKSYFEYTVVYFICGIPHITLQGTPEDWQLVLDKAKRLKQYGLTEWIEELEPILTEFVRTAEGKPNQEFWQCIVKMVRITELQGSSCLPTNPTELDGWILKFFPDEHGRTLDKVPHNKNMMADRVRVSFRYKMINPGTGEVAREIPMELWAGFIGTEVNIETCTMTPKIGWLVRIGEQEEGILNKLESENSEERGGIRLRVKEVPDILAKLKYIKYLALEFTDKVVLPEWMDEQTIESFIITGNMTDEEEADILKRFPKANINRK